MPGKFVVKKGTTGKFRFSLLSTNGQIVATSEAYNTQGLRPGRHPFGQEAGGRRRGRGPDHQGVGRGRAARREAEKAKKAKKAAAAKKSAAKAKAAAEPDG